MILANSIDNIRSLSLVESIGVGHSPESFQCTALSGVGYVDVGSQGSPKADRCGDIPQT